MSRQPIEPGQFDYDEQDIVGDGPQSSWVPPDEPLASHSYGLTSAEQRRGEIFQDRVRHTNPEVFDLDIHDTAVPVGRLVQDGDEEIDLIDEESNTVAHDSGLDDDDWSAEEAAMHTTETP